MELTYGLGNIRREPHVVDGAPVARQLVEHLLGQHVPDHNTAVCASGTNLFAVG